MATPFEVALQNFQKFADGVHPDFSRMVRQIIQAEYIDRVRTGLGAGDDQGGDLLTDSGGSVPNTPANSVVDSLGKFIDSVSKTYLSSVTAYYTAKGKLADLKVQAKGNPLTQAANLVKPTPASWILWAAVGLGAILLLRPK